MPKSKLSVLTYNLYFSKGLKEFGQLLPKYKPDILCVQEFMVDEQSVEFVENLGYKLADYSYSFFRSFKFFSVATFYNPQTVKHQNNFAIGLSRGFYELVLFFLRIGRTERTALSANFLAKDSGKSFTICNVHLTAMQSTNKVRIKQLKITLDFLKNGKALPTIVTGDFNYMYKRKVLEKIFSKESYLEATNNILYSYEWLILKLVKLRTKPDYVWYKGFRKIKTSRLPRVYSDHFPILAKFEL